MKLGSLRDGGRDGTLVVFSADLSKYLRVPDIARTMQAAIERWSDVRDDLLAVADALDTDSIAGHAVEHDELAAPFPRAVQFLDGSVYLGHMRRARAARGAAMPPDWDAVPLMYQGVSDHFLGPTDPCELPDDDLGIDLEGEIAVVVDDVPMGVSATDAGAHVLGAVLVNDWSLRNLTPVELPKQFGFVQSKPRSALGPAFVSIESLGDSWRDGRVHATVVATVNGRVIGRPDAGRDMYFTYADLIAHAARTRPLAAGTLIGAGTVSNEGHDGAVCLAELRADEAMAAGAPETPFLVDGDTITLECVDTSGSTMFGRLVQTVRLRSGAGRRAV